MKKFIISVIFLIPFYCFAAKIDLSGYWDFRADSLDIGITEKWYGKAFDEQVKLPGSMATNGKGNDITVNTKWTSWIADSAWFKKPLYAKWRKPGNTKVIFWLQPVKEYVGPVWYKKEFIVPESEKDKEFILNMERVHWESTVWLDGEELGMQNSLSTAHRYNLGKLNAGKHSICVRVDNRIKDINVGINAHSLADHTQTNWNGIIGDFYIEAFDSTYISSVQIYPDIGNKCATAEIEIIAHRASKATVLAEALPEASPEPDRKKPSDRHRSRMDIRLEKGLNHIRMTLDMGEDHSLWSEFHPDLYRLMVEMKAGKCRDSVSEIFGMRKFGTDGTQFSVNGYRTFLRGKHDACVFPLTGYPPTTVEQWRSVFRIARQYGINHYRFHSWTPPEAAFTAADIEGIYLQPELPMWCGISRDNQDLNDYILKEGMRLLEEYGNHPSFVMFSLGNELHGDTGLMSEWTDIFRNKDDRHLYCFGSNNNLGWNGPQEGEDFFVGRVNEQVQHEVKLQQKSKELILRSRKFQFFPWPAVDLQLD